RAARCSRANSFYPPSFQRSARFLCACVGDRSRRPERELLAWNPAQLHWLPKGERGGARQTADQGPDVAKCTVVARLGASSAGRNARMLPQFAAFARRTGLAEFWDKNGPPDLCAKVQSADYVCDTIDAANASATVPTFTRATGVAIAPNGVIYVADFAEHAIR